MSDTEDRRQAEKEFAELLDVLPQYMCVYGAEGNPLYANMALYQPYAGLQHLRGYEPQAIVHKS